MYVSLSTLLPLALATVTMMETRADRRRAKVRKRRIRHLLWVAVVTVVVVVAALVVTAIATRGGGHSKPEVAPAVTALKAKPPTTPSTTVPAVVPGPDGPQATWVVEENKRPGTTGWQITGPQTGTGITGYADQVQVTAGQTVGLYVSTAAPTFHVEAYRMGYYQGTGARLVWQSPETPGAPQPPCPVTPGINMVQCAWTRSLQFTVNDQWVQGEYLLKLVGSGGQQSYVPLTVWDPSSHSAYVIMDGVLTTEVFNPYGGFDLYQGGTPCAPGVYPCSSRARVVSFDRPYDNSYGSGAGTYLTLVYPLTRLAEEDGLDVTYWTDITLDTDSVLLANHRVLISPGHDEEWTANMRNQVLTSFAQGVNLIFFGASAILRKVRLQPSPLGPDRQIVNYRDPTQDPLYGKDNANVSQNQWDQPPASWEPSTLLGGSYVGYNNHASFPLIDTDPGSWLYAGANMAAGAGIPGVLTADFQAYQPGGPTPPNVEILSHSPIQNEANVGDKFADTTYWTSATSKAGVFQSGSTNWIPSLAPCPAATPACPAATLAILTDNLLRLFGQGPSGVQAPSQPNAAQVYG